MLIWSKVAKKHWQIPIIAISSESKELSKPENHYRLRVGDYRVIFTRQGLTLSDLFIVSVKRRTSTTYLHEENMPYGCSDN